MKLSRIPLLVFLFVTTCAVSNFQYGYTDPETGVTIGGTYSSKHGHTTTITITPSK